MADQHQIRSSASRVKVHSLLSVVSSKPIEPGKVHQLSLLDQAMALHTLHIVFYYRSNPFLAGDMPTEMDNLRVSLSRLLDEYPVATGRLSRGSDGGGWIIKCNDAGVRMVHAAVNATMDEWLRSADVEEQKDLTAWEDMPLDPTFWSPFRIQINNFKCGALGLGLSCTHMHADVASATQLIKSWAEIHCGLPYSQSPNFCVPVSSSPISIPSFRLSPIPVAPSKMATVTFKFPGHAIKKCLSQVQTQYPNVTSPFDILSALFWSRIARLQEHPLSPNHTLSICTDMRSSTVPYSFFGNAIHFSELDLNADTLLNGGLGLVSDYIQRHVEGLKADDFWSVTQWLEDHHGKELREGQPFRVYAPRLMCLSMEHMVDEEGRGLMYGAVFNKDGENCPAHVSYRVGGVEGEGLIIVMASGEGGQGRTVTVTLPGKHIDDLCKDEAIVELEPSMILSGIRN